MTTETITAETIETALREAGLRNYVDAVEDAVDMGEVVLWIAGMGHPVYTVAEAIALARP